jgi:hypothetical protein
MDLHIMNSKKDNFQFKLSQNFHTWLTNKPNWNFAINVIVIELDIIL